MTRRWFAPGLAVLTAVLGACSAESRGAPAFCTAAPEGKLAVLIQSAKGKNCFVVERAITPADQQRGLMFRTDLTKDGGMLFWPYPAEGGPPKDASFWMKNTPSSLDIIFIRADGTIASIAEDATPYDETPLTSGEPVGAVLEIPGGRAAELGIVIGDRVRWPGQKLGK